MRALLILTNSILAISLIFLISNALDIKNLLYTYDQVIFHFLILFGGIFACGMFLRATAYLIVKNKNIYNEYTRHNQCPRRTSLHRRRH